MRFDTHALAWLVHLSKWLLSVITLLSDVTPLTVALIRCTESNFSPSQICFCLSGLPLWATFPPIHPPIQPASLPCLSLYVAPFYGLSASARSISNKYFLSKTNSSSFLQHCHLLNCCSRMKYFLTDLSHQIPICWL